VTIKLPHNQSLTENELRRFLREGEAAAQLSHPQLAGIYEVGNDTGTFYIVTTFVDGNNLRQHASKQPLQFKEIVALCAEIGDALQCAHDGGVVHRDLKPANIIVDLNGLPHIIDFGLAKIQDADHDLTMNGELLGTPAYMPPELANGDGAKADSRTDVYSLGVILYELLTGRCPFDGNRGAIISQILACAPAKPRSLRSAIPRDLETICLKAIEKDPKKRYATARDMSEDLRRFASGLPIRARRVGLSEKCWGWIRRHPALTASAVLVTAAILVASTTIASLQNRNKRLAGFRPVYITTTPPGARVALVPLDPSTNEPYPDGAGIVRPSKTTPLTTELKAGNYLVEAVLSGGETPAFAEVYRTVLDSSHVRASNARTNLELALEPDTCRFEDIKIVSQLESAEKIVRIVIPPDTRKENPLLPQTLYVDTKQTTPAELKANPKFARLLSVSEDGSSYISYLAAIRWAELNQMQIPSSADYDAIITAAKRGEARNVHTGEAAKMDDLFDDVPEWSTTIKTESKKIGGNAAARHLREMHVLRGFTNLTASSELFPWAEGSLLADPDAKSPKISIRGVRCATPRYVMP
jgi:hypothetical protein